MKVLFCCRPRGINITGGERTQIYSTARALQKLGVDVSITTDAKPSVKEYDLVHVFSIAEPHHTYEQVKNARDHGKPIALTPIYWNTNEYLSWEASTPRDLADVIRAHSLYTHFSQSRLGEAYRKKPFYVRWFVRNIMSLLLRRRLLPLVPTTTKEQEFRLRSKILLMSDLILPNGIAEKEIIIKDFVNLSDDKFIIVYNGVSPELFTNLEPELFIKKSFVMCAARIERRKNQLRLIQAMRGEDIPLVLVGKCYDKIYLKQCKSLAGENVYFLDEIPHEQLPRMYAAAKVHALISWYETPGLSSLEAALAGCNIVSTNRGPTMEYFGPFAWYCDPSDIRSIREAVLSAYYSPIRNILREEITRRFTWDSIARELIEIYEYLLESANVDAYHFAHYPQLQTAVL